MNDNVKKVSQELEPVLEAVEKELIGWTSDKCMQFPSLLNSLAVALDWTDEDKRRYDHVVRFYIWKHPEWTSIRGAKGGITRRDKVKLKADAKQAQAAIKAQLEAKLDAALHNSKLQATITTDVVVEAPVSSDEIFSELDELDDFNDE